MISISMIVMPVFLFISIHFTSSTSIAYDPRSSVETILDGRRTSVCGEPVTPLADGEWAVVSTSGDVRWTTEEKLSWSPLQPGVAVGPSSRILSGASGWTLLGREGRSIAVGADSNLSIPQRGESAVTRLDLTHGTLIINSKASGRALEVKTPLLSIESGATTFGVSVDSDAVSVRVSDGIAKVKALDSIVEAHVTAGKTATLRADNQRAIEISDTAIDPAILELEQFETAAGTGSSDAGEGGDGGGAGGSAGGSAGSGAGSGSGGAGAGAGAGSGAGGGAAGDAGGGGRPIWQR